MHPDFEIVPIIPFNDGQAAGKKLGRQKVRQTIRAALKHVALRETLGAMSRASLEKYVINRLETPPDFNRFPELADIYPERIEYLRGFAQGADCPLVEAAALQYVEMRVLHDNWWRNLQCFPPQNHRMEEGHCSGALMVGPDGVIGAHSLESAPPPKPRGYRHRPTKPFRRLKPNIVRQDRVILRRPRTGYVAEWGVGNERGVAGVCATSCSTFLDDPIEDTWPVNQVPLMRFARDVRHLEELIARYALHNWGRHSAIYGDPTGNAVAVEHSFRRVGFRRLDRNKADVIWCTEGHFESPEMNAFIRARRLEYFNQAGKHLGAPDNEYFTDSAVRFVHIGQLCHEPWGLGLDHLRRVMTDHAPFPRAVCRHGGPDTAAYDTSVTMMSTMTNITTNTSYVRRWEPWKKWCCQVPETITQGPARP